jgi:hypothetical protein
LAVEGHLLRRSRIRAGDIVDGQDKDTMDVTKAAAPANNNRDCAKRLERKRAWATQMGAANDGYEASYRELLGLLAAVLRTVVERGFKRAGVAAGETEDAVQETLLAIHLKRHTWRRDEPIGPPGFSRSRATNYN